jgi:hypothetical protein
MLLTMGLRGTPSLCIFRRPYILHIPHPAFEDGPDRGFRNVGKTQSDAREIPKRTYTIFKTQRKFEIKNYAACLKYSVRIFIEQIFKMQRPEVSGAVQPLGVKGLRT